MGLDIGLYFLLKGHPVRWYTRTPERAGPFSKAVTRRIKSLALIGDGDGPDPSLASFGLIGEEVVPAADFVLETSTEDLSVKKEILGWFGSEMPSALLGTNSSSLLPSQIGGEVLGVHFFYPTELSGFVELIDSSLPKRENVEKVRELLTKNGLRIVSQDERTAFAANTLTLPLLAEAAVAVAAGADPEKTDAACRGGWLSIGPLALMDAVGIDVIGAAVKSYSSRAPDVPSDYVELLAILDRMVEAGKLGDKSGGGFLGASPFPFPSDPQMSAPEEDSMALLMLNRCGKYLRDNLLDTPDLNLILASLYQASAGYHEFLAQKGEERVRSWAALAFARAAKSYLIPSG